MWRKVLVVHLRRKSEVWLLENIRKEDVADRDGCSRR
jgi:hypothetical protein